MLKSIMSYPDRGKWGDNKYRGNCSGYVIRDLLTHFAPKKFTEIFAGGGTGFDVCKDLGVSDSLHLDLNPRWGQWNALKDDVPRGSDFIFAHPPYHDIIKYSGAMWGEPHPDDLSRCVSYDEFISKNNLVNEKLFYSLKSGGRLAVLIGDVRRNGEYFPIFADMKRIGVLDGIIVKEQHNCFSSKTQYRGKFIPIVHEYILIFKKNDAYAIPYKFLVDVEEDIRDVENSTWRDVVYSALENVGGSASLSVIYGEIEGSRKANKNAHWREKVRQTLQINGDFKNLERGVWAVAS